jgi:ornithine cyclodeaminase/alanine dehydrogenase-like protein (mu-crystallin family)
VNTLLLSEKDVQNLVSMKEAVESIERCFKSIKDQSLENRPRLRTRASKSTFNVMTASLDYLGRAGVKVYYSGKFAILLYDTNKSELLAVLAAAGLGKYRTGAASAVATKYLTNLKSFRLAIAGTGREAHAQVAAMKEVANIEEVFVWSPTADHRRKFTLDIQRDGFEAIAVDSASEAFSKADVATVITSAKEPFVSMDIASHPMHINACGSNHPDRSELTVDSLKLFPKIYVDDLSQAKIEARELIEACGLGVYEWKNVIELKDVVQARANKVENSHTLFRSLGIAAEDVAIASLVYDKASRQSEQYRSYEFE